MALHVEGRIFHSVTAQSLHGCRGDQLDRRRAGNPAFHAFLKEMFAEGLGKRIMFGTDQMRWPDAIGLAVRAIETADFLTDEQKRDILYNNAARFLDIPAEDIARHHGR